MDGRQEPRRDQSAVPMIHQSRYKKKSLPSQTEIRGRKRVRTLARPLQTLGIGCAASNGQTSPARGLDEYSVLRGEVELGIPGLPGLFGGQNEANAVLVDQAATLPDTRKGKPDHDPKKPLAPCPISPRILESRDGWAAYRELWMHLLGDGVGEFRGRRRSRVAE